MVLIVISKRFLLYFYESRFPSQMLNDKICHMLQLDKKIKPFLKIPLQKTADK